MRLHEAACADARYKQLLVMPGGVLGLSFEVNNVRVPMFRGQPRQDGGGAHVAGVLMRQD